MRETVLARCQAALPGWRGLAVDDVDFDPPKGFSSFTMGVRPRPPVDPPAVLYRQLGGKENAILDPQLEREVFLLLGAHGIAARCLHYGADHRIEEFYRGRTLTAGDVFDPELQRGIAHELYRLHQLAPSGLPAPPFFELLHRKWGAMARDVLGQRRSAFPAEEQALCDDLTEIYQDSTLAKVRRCLPDRDPVFCHNDTYHGNVMLLDDGTVKLLDFEFSCRNHVAFDFANLFAETAMRHGLPDPPHFTIAEPTFTDDDVRSLIACYLDHADFDDADDRDAELAALTVETRRALMLSDFMYAMAALPLALEPIQPLRFVPYAHRRFARFRRAWDAEFG